MARGFILNIPASCRLENSLADKVRGPLASSEESLIPFAFPGFPDDVSLGQGSPEEMMKIVGNSVPMGLGVYVASILRRGTTS